MTATTGTRPLTQRRRGPLDVLNSILVTINWTNANDAYAITLTP